MEITIRRCLIEDANYIYKLNKFSLGYDYPLEKTKEKLEKILDNNSYRVLVAVYKGEVVAYIEAHDYESLYQDSLKDIMALVVAKDFQNMGIGGKLIDRIEKWARNEGSKGLRLVSREKRQETHMFYRKKGFKEIKLQKNFKKYFLNIENEKQ
ncbi:GNAT family N-acetyltransferase [Miniphocaeibacter halophilus]|uniref:GNAT family N-acetyltransferase n=1 Tax=Miniphocaeibacter halophilus TaxID=2931922 RepID=A0AC61MP73_9FIRM|nr:GNAT family N-acetyltransferase [Miniphocaeibacter halophilus]QQK06928.1 GNAT family N-acetyltransferase [Miniphocaeibacter halophilus]